jgi:hypothetical protein
VYQIIDDIAFEKRVRVRLCNGQSDYWVEDVLIYQSNPHQLYVNMSNQTLLNFTLENLFSHEQSWSTPVTLNQLEHKKYPLLM